MNRDLLLNTRVDEAIQGHVGQNTKQVFETLDGQPFAQPKLKLTGYEFIQRDQFQNHYHLMRAVLFDGEMYDVAQWIKPSLMMAHGGGRAAMDDWAARHKLRITESLLRELREIGAMALARMNIEILKGRQASTAPVGLETHDLTHQANVLEDAIVAAKAAQGETIPTEPLSPPPLEAEKPATAKKAGKGATIPYDAPDPITLSAMMAVHLTNEAAKPKTVTP